MGLFSRLGLPGVGRRDSNRSSANPGPRLRPNLEGLEERIAPAQTYLLTSPAQQDGRTKFADLQFMLNNLPGLNDGSGGSVLVEPGALDQSVIVNQPPPPGTPDNNFITIRGDSTYGPANMPTLSFDMIAKGVTLDHLKIGSVTLEKTSSGNTFTSNLFTGTSLGYALLEMQGSPGSNVISANTFLTTNAQSPALVSLGNVNGGSDKDQVLNNTFLTGIGTMGFAQTTLTVPPPDASGGKVELAYLTVLNENTSIIISGNVFRSTDPVNESTFVRLTDDVGAVFSNNTTYLADFAPSPSFIPGTTAIPPLSTALLILDSKSASSDTEVKVDNNTFWSNISATGVASVRLNGFTNNGVGSKVRVEFSNNDFAKSLVGISVTGAGDNSSDDFDGPGGSGITNLIDVGGGGFGSTGGNNFHVFSGGTQNFAIITNDSGAIASGATVFARNNIFGAFTPSGVVSTYQGTNIDTSTRMAPSPSNQPGTLASIVQQVFHDFLGRAPTTSDVNSFASLYNSGGSGAVANAVSHSAEAATVFVRGLYLNLLGRTADAGGLQNWVTQLGNGMTHEQVMANFLASAEYFNRQQQLNPQGDPNGTYVQSLYTNLFGRVASADEVANWEKLILNFGRLATTLTFLQTAEFRTDQVRAYYGDLPLSVLVPIDILHRRTTPAPSELSFWVNSGLNIQTIEIRLMTAGEFAAFG